MCIAHTEVSIPKMSSCSQAVPFKVIFHIHCVRPITSPTISPSAGLQQALLGVPADCRSSCQPFLPFCDQSVENPLSGLNPLSLSFGFRVASAVPSVVRFSFWQGQLLVLLPCQQVRCEARKLHSRGRYRIYTMSPVWRRHSSACYRCVLDVERRRPEPSAS